MPPNKVIKNNQHGIRLLPIQYKISEIHYTDLMLEKKKQIKIEEKAKRKELNVTNKRQVGIQCR